MEPKYKPLQQPNVFLGHFFDHDVYLRKVGLGSRLITVSENDRIDYQYANVLHTWLEHSDPTAMGGRDSNGKEWSCSYREWVFSDRCPHRIKAMFTAVLTRTLPIFDTPDFEEERSQKDTEQNLKSFGRDR